MMQPHETTLTHSAWTGWRWECSCGATALDGWMENHWGKRARSKAVSGASTHRLYARRRDLRLEVAR